MKSLQNLSFVSDISTDASIDEMISILKYNRTVASDMARQNAYLNEANARISNFQAKHGEQELECQEKVDTNQENLEDLYTMFYKPILDLEVTPTLKQDIICGRLCHLDTLSLTNSTYSKGRYLYWTSIKILSML